MIIKSYVEGEINPRDAETGWVSNDDDHVRRHGLIRSCVDAFLEYEIDGKRGILLLQRDDVPPAPNCVWTPGGEWKRGIMDPREALKLKIKEETGLDVLNPQYLGMVNVLWKESPYNSEKWKKLRKNKKLGEGIHDISHVFFAKAKGDLNLKSMKGPAIIITKENYDDMVRKYSLHGYIRDFLKEALKKVNHS